MQISGLIKFMDNTIATFVWPKSYSSSTPYVLNQPNLIIYWIEFLLLFDFVCVCVCGHNSCWFYLRLQYRILSSLIHTYQSISHCIWNNCTSNAFSIVYKWILCVLWNPFDSNKIQYGFLSYNDDHVVHCSGAGYFFKWP